MILPIYAYGHGVLKRRAKAIDQDYPHLEELVQNMWETMYKADGVGLAAPQVGLGIRLFLVDTKQMKDEGKEEEGIKIAFLNAEKVEEGGKEWTYEEGCLSIPDVRGDVDRPAQIKLRWVDTDFNEHEQIFTGLEARVIQHEYDHIEGTLFTEYLKPIKRRLIKRKLENIKKGKVKAGYKMRFPSTK